MNIEYKIVSLKKKLLNGKRCFNSLIVDIKRRNDEVGWERKERKRAGR